VLLESVAASIARTGVSHEVMPCDPELADTAAFCEHYAIDPADSANTILVVSKRPAGTMAACVVLATTRLDVNKAVCAELGAKKASFASAEQTTAATGMEIGGVTPFGLPASMPVYVDAGVMTRPRIVLGGGNRTSKLRIDPAALETLPGVRVIEGLAKPLA
jgi:prolyl-tRNA editing enzyme YbaK/EbsC (Cys-tRNA(Pro) deacylase)